jgi:hypothetical protein
VIVNRDENNNVIGDEFIEGEDYVQVMYYPKAILYSTVLCCTLLYCTAVYYPKAILYYTVLYCAVL